MVPVAATELKTNFKYYMDVVESGEVLAIRRPKKVENIYVVNEHTYKQFLRLQEYIKELDKEPKIKLGMFDDAPFIRDWDEFERIDKELDKEIEKLFYGENDDESIA